MSDKNPKKKSDVVSKIGPDMKKLDGMDADQLGEHLKDLIRKTVENIWMIGYGLNLAERKVVHGKWEEWCVKYVPQFSKATIWRWRKVAELPFEEVKGTKIGDVYKRLAAVPSGGAAASGSANVTTTKTLGGSADAKTTGTTTEEKDADAATSTLGGSADATTTGTTTEEEDNADIDAEVARIVETWPATVSAVKRACLSLAKALDIEPLEVERVLALLVKESWK
jgi:hypothetical protein